MSNKESFTSWVKAINADDMCEYLDGYNGYLTDEGIECTFGEYLYSEWELQQEGSI